MAATASYRNRMLTVAVFLGAALFVSDVSAATDASFAIIVNEDRDLKSISKSELSEIFLRKRIAWDDGTPIQPVDLSLRSSLRASFSKVVHDLSILALKSYWERQIFTGGERPPTVKGDEDAVIAYVQSHPGAIGYVSADRVVSGVRTAAIVGE